jgi:hypothetical protein
LVLRPTLKGSLNLKVSKGPEETNGTKKTLNQTARASISGFSRKL